MIRILILLLLCGSVSGCAKPQSGSDGADGQPGPPGVSIAGPTGAVGASGAPGAQGLPGTNAVLEVITLCPTLPGSYPEVLWRITGGYLYAVYDGGANDVHLTAVVPGTYVSTDGRGCVFTVDSDLSITY